MDAIKVVSGSVNLLAAKNYDVNTINIAFLNKIPCDTTTYQSIDTVMSQDEIIKYPTEFLNSTSRMHCTF
ncbi:ATP-dependent DNA helicase PIF1-like [Aphis craccivora]|uniref:ATP-dependent DNA helicase PIF1-like n=1 Tax=Aphis craccivora TaxID=307492 RepID=A0A6G0VPF6_APHCR|nr:ATP-dependent DNA helicase PIF1-like [Aphis craccivora]